VGVRLLIHSIHHIVVKIVGIEMDDQGRLCKEHINFGMVLDDDQVVHIKKVQAMVKG
jgi:hypothetical protein